MAKICDNTSVGQIILNGGNIAVIERHNYPQAYALPAGHVDGPLRQSESEASDTPWSAGVERECLEEVGLKILKNKLVLKKELDNPCKREGGSHHLWEIYEAIAWRGELKAGDDAKRAFWKTPEELRAFAARTEYFMRKYDLPYSEVGKLTRAIFGDPAAKQTDPEWISEMGLEPVWYYILTKVGVI